MKKTITLLLVAAGLAAAATDPMDIAWDEYGTASLNDGQVLESISVVFTLDFASLAVSGPIDTGVNTPIFSWSGTAEGQAANGGVTHYLLDYANWMGSEYTSQLYFTAPANNTNGFGTTSVADYVKAIIGYTYGVGEVATAYLTLIDADGNKKEYEPVSGSTKGIRSSLYIDTLSKNSAVSEIEVYWSLLSADEIAAAMTNLAGAGSTPSEPTPSVPEPTTATLSLLALAGLAARRRRR